MHYLDGFIFPEFNKKNWWKSVSLQIQLFPKGSISLAELLQTLEDIPARDTAKAPANILQQ